MPVHEADLNTFCNSMFYINTVMSYHLCEINSKFIGFVQMSPQFLSFLSREVHLYLVQCILCKRSESCSRKSDANRKSQKFSDPSCQQYVLPKLACFYCCVFERTYSRLKLDLTHRSAAFKQLFLHFYVVGYYYQ